MKPSKNEAKECDVKMILHDCDAYPPRVQYANITVLVRFYSLQDNDCVWPFKSVSSPKIIRIWHECEVRTDKSVPRVTVLASRGSVE